MRRLLLIVPLLLGACEDDSPPCAPGDCVVDQFCDHDHVCKALPAFSGDFLWGTAIAGFQADYGCPTLPRTDCEDVNSDWFAFTTDPRTVESGSAYLSGDHPSEVGPGFWELYEADFERASSELHNNAFRLSIEWSRIFPTATDAANTHEELMALASPAGLEKYRAMFAAMKARGLKPMVTLNHYALPIWIHDAPTCHMDFANCDRRGWVDDERTIREIAKFSGFVAREFGSEVDLWATLNEPLQNMLFGYFQPSEARSHPPALSFRPNEARTVFSALITGHARMVDAVRANDLVDADGDGHATRVGIVYPLVPISPIDPNDPADQSAAQNIDYLWNRAFLRAVALGQEDPDLDGVSEHREDLAGRMDWIGVNWYFGISVAGAPTSFLPAFSPLLTVDPLRFIEGKNEPDRLEEMLKFINDELGFPAYISENGANWSDDDPDHMERFIVRNVDALQRAVARGADVRGYFYWTFMDNFEWNHGDAWKMGLYAVDGAGDPQKTRVARPAAHLYGRMAKDGTIPFADRQKHRAP
jgi:beta-galactosidase